MISIKKTDKRFNPLFCKITLLLTSTLTSMTSVNIIPALPDIANAFQEIPNVEFLVKFLLSIHALLLGLSAPIIGMLMDQWGRKNILSIAIVLFCISGSSGFFLNSLYAILISRVFLGIGAAGIRTGITTLMGDYFKGLILNRFVGFQSAAVGIGSAIFVILGGVLADINWRIPFLIYLFGLFVLPEVLTYIYEPPINKKSESKCFSSSREAFPIKNLFLVYALTFLGMLFCFILPIQLPFYLASLNVSNTKIGIANAIMAAISTIIALAYPTIIKYFSYKQIYNIFFLFVSLSFLIIAFSKTYSNVLIGMSIHGIGYGLLLPNSSVWLLSFVPSYIRGRYSGGLTSCFLAGQFIAPIFSQPIVKLIGIDGTFGLVGGIMLCMLVIFGLINFVTTKEVLRK